MSETTNLSANKMGLEVELFETEEIIDLEEYAKANQRPPKAKRYRIRIDKQQYVVEVPFLTGRQLLQLAQKMPPERYRIYQKLCGGHKENIGFDEKADFTRPGVERFMTLPLDQTEG